MGDEDCLQQAGNHQSQAEGEENIWGYIDESVSVLVTFQFKQYTFFDNLPLNKRVPLTYEWYGVASDRQQVIHKQQEDGVA